MTTLVLPLKNTDNNVLNLEINKDNTVKCYMIIQENRSKESKNDKNIILDILENFQFSIRIDNVTLSQIYDNQLRKECIQIRIYYLPNNLKTADRLKKILEDRCEEMTIPVSINTFVKEVEVV